MKKFYYVDALRGLAILGVILVHTNQIGLTAGGFLDPIVNQGARGVQLFFVASAFTLFLSKDNRDEDKHKTISFFIRRFFRIAPMFYLAIAYYLWQYGFGSRFWLGDEPRITVSNIFSNITFTNGFNPYWQNSTVPGAWSISNEFLFYALLPLFLFKTVKNLNSAVYFFLISISFSYICNIYLSNHQLISSSVLWKEYLFFYFPSQLPVFALGIICYYLIIKKESFANINQTPILILILLALLQLSKGFKFFPEHIIFSIFFALLMITLSTFPSKLLVNKFTTFIGKLSFSLYITHFAVIYWLDKFNLSDFSDIRSLNYFIRLSIILTICVAISYFTYNLIEKKFIKIGSKLIHKLNYK